MDKCPDPRAKGQNDMPVFSLDWQKTGTHDPECMKKLHRGLGSRRNKSPFFRLDSQGRMMAIELTDREKEALILIRMGMSSKQAADEMAIAKRTVDSHLSEAYSKLHVNNRIQAIKVAERLGLIPKEDA